MNSTWVYHCCICSLIHEEGFHSTLWRQNEKLNYETYENPRLKQKHQQTKQNTKQNKTTTLFIFLLSWLHIVFPRIIALGVYLFFASKGAIIRGKAIIRERRLFQILLTGSRVLKILFYYPLKWKSYPIK